VYLRRWRAKLSCALARGVGAAVRVGSQRRLREDHARAMQVADDVFSGMGAAAAERERDDDGTVAAHEHDLLNLQAGDGQPF